ncbi:MAG: fibrobacter succinogenes major paralogous domain-containing protein [Bacteroidales bacterium]|nr:fibrobacter succinogenes major paralogous domain-containing protein [Bacteroidales bacterium]
MKKVMFCLFLIVAVSVLLTTTMTVHTTSGDHEFDIGEITSITFGGGTVTDIDGNVYQTLVIGDQEWMVENLKVTHYNNGDPIPHLTDGGDWSSTNEGAYCVYDNEPSNADTYGNLYNWYAVDDPRGLAPEGWHVPEDEEIMELEMYLGMTYEEAHDTGWRGTNEGSKLAGNADLWYNGDLENDTEFGSSGFDFLPGGYRNYYGGLFSNLSYSGAFWSSTENDSSGAWYRGLDCSFTDVNRYFSYGQGGFSVRCVRD